MANAVEYPAWNEDAPRDWGYGIYGQPAVTSAQQLSSTGTQCWILALRPVNLRDMALAIKEAGGKVGNTDTADCGAASLALYSKSGNVLTKLADVDINSGLTKTGSSGNYGFRLSGLAQSITLSPGVSYYWGIGLRGEAARSNQPRLQMQGATTAGPVGTGSAPFYLWKTGQITGAALPSSIDVTVTVPDSTTGTPHLAYFLFDQSGAEHHTIKDFAVAISTTALKFEVPWRRGANKPYDYYLRGIVLDDTRSLTVRGRFENNNVNDATTEVFKWVHNLGASDKETLSSSALSATDVPVTTSAAMISLGCDAKIELRPQSASVRGNLFFQWRLNPNSSTAHPNQRTSLYTISHCGANSKLNAAKTDAASRVDSRAGYQFVAALQQCEWMELVIDAGACTAEGISAAEKCVAFAAASNGGGGGAQPTGAQAQLGQAIKNTWGYPFWGLAQANNGWGTHTFNSTSPTLESIADRIFSDSAESGSAADMSQTVFVIFDFPGNSSKADPGPEAWDNTGVTTQAGANPRAAQDAFGLAKLVRGALWWDTVPGERGNQIIGMGIFPYVKSDAIPGVTAQAWISSTSLLEGICAAVRAPFWNAYASLAADPTNYLNNDVHLTASGAAICAAALLNAWRSGISGRTGGGGGLSVVRRAAEAGDAM